MKSETREIIKQASKRNEKYRVLKLSDFHSFYKQPRLKAKKVSFSLYKKIIKEFFRIYFFDFYFFKRDMYFPFGGRLKLIIASVYIAPIKDPHTKKIVKKKISNPLRWLWYLRPGFHLYTQVDIKKLTGKHNVVPKLETIFNQENDKNLLPIFTSEIKKMKKHKILFKCFPN